MKLILTAAVEKLGLAGDVVEVKDGYGRNFLLPQGYAIAWTRGAEKQIEGIKRARDAREVRDAEHAQELRDQLEDLSVSITARVSESGQLFGAITANDVVQAVRKAGGPALDRRSIEFSKPVKNTGEHVVGIKLHDSVNAHLRVEVVAA
ncbi:50S ribosomal protein L9 [Parenemella sanctibonifatiensis]|uniref:Large ribosomal subunit protein bL9 n=1 Tax=Parenemella sanctibonifatiensis TaxID=2016505 RepID=A0A255DZB0_9ACTN|nr:50S ribosomal protein L9 [Parenemella sanctibonifatiensis]OYN84101.1 50S ribosomal protein L9 [Parenemella sanctibonifatiensis]